MIDYDTILSTTEDKMTLLQWLKKVEAALKDASATSFKVNKKGDATLTFSIVFADGTELESGEIILQQGESVQSAAIVNGHLILTLTNGDELDAGDLGGVTSFSIDASQHLIVTYQNGTTQDLGAIFAGNVNIAGIFTALHAKVFEQIEDANNHTRFFDGAINTNPIEGITYTYARWSLSGSHLMLVIAGTAEAGAVINDSTDLGLAPMPQWVLDKIFPYSGYAVDMKDLINRTSYYTQENLGLITLLKISGQLEIRNISGPHTFTNAGNFRVQFDLLIDNA